VEAAKEYAADYTLIGDREQIEKIAGENGWDISSFTIVHTTDVMTMEDDPLSIRRAKKDCSMAIGLRMLANGEGDAFVSTGNTGALFTGATLLVRRIPGIQRAALATVLPGTNPVMLLDCGANVVVEPDYLEQFAVMGSIYMKKMFSLESPRVALLNNGTESCKGTPVHVEAYQKLSQSECIHFVGNVEANKIAIGACDVLVTDGFTGNIPLDDGIFLKDDSTLLTVDGDGTGFAGIANGRALHNTDGAVVVFYQHVGGVFGLDGTGNGAAVGIYALDATH
jgi:glycerol-3-phosphate acyltransferase PlsX